MADIIITAPLPEFLSQPLARDYRCHDYYHSSQKPALLAAEGARILGLVQGGGTITPTTLLDQLPKLEIISVFGVGYDGVPVEYCRRRNLKVTNTPDVLTDDVADVALPDVAELAQDVRGIVHPRRRHHAQRVELRGVREQRLVVLVLRFGEARDHPAAVAEHADGAALPVALARLVRVLELAEQVDHVVLVLREALESGDERGPRSRFERVEHRGGMHLLCHDL
jgi:hypothetical protein